LLSLSFWLPHQNPICIHFLPIRGACPAHTILLYVTILMIFDEEFKLRNPPLCSFLHPPTVSSPFSPNVLLSTLFSSIFNLRSSLNIRLGYCKNKKKSDCKKCDVLTGTY
jgi:hypothetical protein